MEKINLNNYKAVFLDFDGTMIDTEKLHLKAFNRVLEEIGVEEISWERHKKEFMTKGSKHGFALIKSQNPHLEFDHLEKRERKTKLYQEMLRESSAVDGLHDFIDELRRRNIIIHITSSAQKTNIETGLNAIQLEHLPFMSGEDHLKHKPNPEVFEKVAKLYDLVPSEVLVIEDSPAGIKAGIAFGADTIGITTAHSNEELLKDGANWVIQDFKGLL